MTKHFIVAPQLSTGRLWADQNGVPERDRVHVVDPDQLRGLTNPTVVWLGYPEHWSGTLKDECRINLDLAQRGDMKVIEP